MTDQKERWRKIQDELRKKLCIPNQSPGPGLDMDLNACPYVIGLDISYIKNSISLAVCTAVLLKYHDPSVLLDHETKEVTITNPYYPGYLAFRELDSYIMVFQNLMARHLDIYDQIAFVMLDGNGILHPNGLGLASHFGVVTGFRTIGCGKNLHQIDGMSAKTIRESMTTVNEYPLIGQSGRAYGWALRKEGVKNPIYISPGHRVSHDDARSATIGLMLFREPEPTRQADRVSREYIRSKMNVL